MPIPKSAKDTTNPTNYWSIALTSCICKTLEGMINNRLIWFLEKNKLIINLQTGFRKARSTIDHLIHLETLIRKAFAKKEHMTAIFFDIEKAYDTTWKYGVIKDLKNMGLKGKLLIFIENFLNNRKFQVQISTTLSELQKQEMGVSQGSILSVTLFNIKINNIVTCLNLGVKRSLYVDDFLICCKSKYIRIIECQLQQYLNKINNWTIKNGFKFSKNKTQCIHFCNLYKIHNGPVLKLDSTEIPIVEEHKFLGIIFDKKLTFKPHIKYLRSKSNSTHRLGCSLKSSTKTLPNINTI